MNKKTNYAKTVLLPVLTVLSVAVTGLLVAAGYLLIERGHLRDQLTETADQLQVVSNEVESQKQLLRPVVTTRDNSVTIPEAKLVLPYNDVTKYLLYAYTGDDLRITSALVSDHKTRQMSCDELVRINFKSGTPYSPWEASAGSVKLSDGRIAHIFAAKAYKNNEASTEACAEEVWQQVTPQQMADAFKAATTY